MEFDDDGVALVAGRVAGRRISLRVVHPIGESPRQPRHDVACPGGSADRKEELARWRIRAAAAAKTLADIRTPERRQLDRLERKVSGDLTSPHRQRNDRADWFASQALPRATWPWLRDPPVVDRGLDLGIGR